MWRKISSFFLFTVALQAAERRFVAEEAHMGTVFRITVYADEFPQEALRAAFERVAELDEKLSDYKPDSEIMRLCRNAVGRAVPVSSDLMRVLRASLQLSQDSEGAFDVTAGPVTRLWRAKRIPSAEELRVAREAVGYRNVILGEGTVELRRAGMSIDFGAIAKGYAAEEALAVLRSHGLPRALVAASGDLAIGDPPLGKSGWTVALEPLDTRQVRELRNTCVGTSGDREQYVEIGGVKYSHIIDPDTGMGLTKRVGVSTIAKDGMLADALGTAISVVVARHGRAAGAALAAKYGAEALIALDAVGTAKEDSNHQQNGK